MNALFFMLPLIIQLLSHNHMTTFLQTSLGIQPKTLINLRGYGFQLGYKYKEMSIDALTAEEFISLGLLEQDH